MDTQTRQAMLARLRQAIPGLMAVYVFGSEARGDSSAASDVDIAVLADHSIDAVSRFHLAGEIASRLGRDVDLVDLRSASTVMQAQVMASGEPLWVDPSAPVDEFEARILSDYARLNEERAAILTGIRERGSVYAR